MDVSQARRIKTYSRTYSPLRPDSYHCHRGVARCGDEVVSEKRTRTIRDAENAGSPALAQGGDLVQAPGRGVGRRSFLQAGLMGVAGLSLPDVLWLRAASATSETPRDVAVIYVLQEGGASQLET